MNQTLKFYDFLDLCCVFHHGGVPILSIIHLIFLSNFANFSPLSYTPISNWMLLTVIPYVIPSKTKSVAINGTVTIQHGVPRFQQVWLLNTAIAANRNSICWI